MTAKRFTQGPTIQPRAALLAWLEEHGKDANGQRPLMRLPVVVRYASHGLPHIEEAFVGTSYPPPDEELLRLKLDDTALGIALADQLQERSTPETPWCALWLEGLWGTLVSGPELGMGKPSLPTFAVLKILEDVSWRPASDPPLRVLVQTSQ